MTPRLPPRLVEMLREELKATGLMELLDAPQTTDLAVNEDGSVWLQTVDSDQRRCEGLTVDADDLESLLGTVASLHGTVISAERPVLEATLPFHGARLEAVLPPVVTAPVLALRKPPARMLTLQDLMTNDTVPSLVADIVAVAVRQRRTCVVAGGVGSGKTTLVNALLADLLRHEPDERIVVLEEGAREVLADGANVIRLLTSEAAGLDMTALLRTALRLNPARLLIGEVRGAEAMDWLRAANTGHPGSLLTVHANSARDALDRLDVLAQEAGVPPQLARIAQAIDFVVFVSRHGAARRVMEVIHVDGADAEGRPLLTDVYRRGSDVALRSWMESHDQRPGDPPCEPCEN